MSKHIGRKKRWVEVSPTRFSGANGYAQLNKYGKWDGVLVYQTRSAIQKSISFIEQLQSCRPWRRTTKHCGEHKRSREAMMAVEQAAKVMKASNNPDILV